MSYGYSKDEFNEITGGFHPASLCGKDCSGCCDDAKHTSSVPISCLDRFSVAALLEDFNDGIGRTTS